MSLCHCETHTLEPFCHDHCLLGKKSWLECLVSTNFSKIVEAPTAPFKCFCARDGYFPGCTRCFLRFQKCRGNHDIRKFVRRCNTTLCNPSHIENTCPFLFPEDRKRLQETIAIKRKTCAAEHLGTLHLIKPKARILCRLHWDTNSQYDRRSRSSWLPPACKAF